MSQPSRLNGTKHAIYATTIPRVFSSNLTIQSHIVSLIKTMASKMEMEVELKSSADKFWGALGDSDALFPVTFPDKYKSIEIVEGDGKSVGSVRLLTYGEGIPIVKFSKEKIEIADEASKTLGYSVIDGELTSFYKVFKAVFQVIPNGKGCTVKGSFEYEKTGDEVPEPDNIKEMAAQTFEELDAYVLKN